METFSALLAICAGSSPVPGEFPAQRPVTRRFDIFFDLHPNKRLSKQWRGWWFETSPCPLRRHLNVSCRYVFVLCCYDLLDRKSVQQWAAAGHNKTRREIWLKPMVLHRITATALPILACHQIDYATSLGQNPCPNDALSIWGKKRRFNLRNVTEYEYSCFYVICKTHYQDLPLCLRTEPIQQL